MTALADLSVLVAWEWREFDADGWAHLYLVAELNNERLELLLPWCLRFANFPLEHSRGGISRDPLIAPPPGWTCPACAAHVWARIPHPRAGTPDTGAFTGRLFEVVTRDALKRA
ncbi:hypothetical protein [Amycolatopsis lexingtonensis]|uniref:hypothetical protein n=1 Tax=Amycolatopsis lexingtonensis TaxID=218822 RepID=UPI003F719774